MNFNKEHYNVLYLLFAILVRIAAGSCRERLTLIYLVAPLPQFCESLGIPYT